MRRAYVIVLLASCSGCGEVTQLPPVLEVVGGPSHTCALLSTGRVRCWGDNAGGQVGDGTNIARPQPTEVVGLQDVTALCTNWTATCAISHGEVWCWGRYDWRDAPNDVNGWGPLPTRVPGISNAVDVVLRYSGGCALNADHTVQCWGGNNAGQVGDGTNTRRTEPTTVVGLGRVLAMSGGPYDHTCALVEDRTVWCWGTFGNGSIGRQPRRVENLQGALSIVSGAHFSCALTQSDVRCWGQYVSNDPSLDAVVVSNRPLAAVVPIWLSAPSLRNACGLTSEGEVRCWSSSSDGTPTNIQTLTQFPAARSLLGGDWSICALDRDGLALYCAARADSTTGTVGPARRIDGLF